jgi:hypothetical protein
MDSALTRMLMYVDAYGLTADRLYATVFMGWIGLLLIWFAVTALYGDGRRFGFGAIASGFAVLAGLNFVNPDRLIASVSLSRAEAGHTLDISHLSRLSADAAPYLISRLSLLDEAESCILLSGAQGRWDIQRHDWRHWNLSRKGAESAMTSQAAKDVLSRCPPIYRADP